ncbi:hypothetical protein Tsubulata_016932 [Turnera subulata]|uniref:YTH domain-containing family protein n=1 Tax=Turnera subulata TaxID=218843 RepID=A0A9Q0FI45_9ROSI|nr:hypothetical protein Tsubulata_016932 [Turnera subulata]
MDASSSSLSSSSASHQEDPDRTISAAGVASARRKHNSMDQTVSSPKDERIVSANASADAAIIGPPPPHGDVAPHIQPSNSAADVGILLPLNAYASLEQTMPYAGYGNSAATWDGYSQYFNTADGLHVSPIIYNENPSLMFHSGYGFNNEMAYGQYSPVASPLPPIMLEGQLFSPQHIPIAAPSFYPQPAPSNVQSSVPLSPSELINPESNSEPFGPGSGYLVHYGSFGGGNMSATLGSSPLPSPSSYPQPMGILGPYEHHIGQFSQQRPYHGYGLASSSPTRHYQHSDSYHGSNFRSGSASYSGANDRMRITFDKGRRRERDQDSINTSNDSLSSDCNRGPRASKPKGKSNTEPCSSSGNGKDDSSASGSQLELYNRPDFVTDYENAKFFIIKSFSEDNVHKSIKYSVWASTPHGNKKLDAAYREAKEKGGDCPVYLFFSVNASGLFCGVAEMIGPVDFERDADYWQQDRWSGQFPVKWHIIKDVPNSRFRHIVLQNNDNKPVTHSRDSQEVQLEQGIEMLKIFKHHDAQTSILDDFEFYDQRETTLKEKRTKQQPKLTTDAPGMLVDGTMNQIADSFVQALKLDGGIKQTAETEMGASSRNDSVVPDNNSDGAVQFANDSDIVVLPSQRFD